MIPIYKDENRWENEKDSYRRGRKKKHKKKKKNNKKTKEKQKQTKKKKKTTKNKNNIQAEMIIRKRRIMKQRRPLRFAPKRFVVKTKTNPTGEEENRKRRRRRRRIIGRWVIIWKLVAWIGIYEWAIFGRIENDWSSGNRQAYKYSYQRMIRHWVLLRSIVSSWKSCMI